MHAGTVSGYCQTTSSWPSSSEK